MQTCVPLAAACPSMMCTCVASHVNHSALCARRAGFQRGKDETLLGGIENNPVLPACHGVNGECRGDHACAGCSEICIAHRGGIQLLLNPLGSSSTWRASAAPPPAFWECEAHACVSRPSVMPWPWSKLCCMPSNDRCNVLAWNDYCRARVTCIGSGMTSTGDRVALHEHRTSMAPPCHLPSGLHRTDDCERLS